MGTGHPAPCEALGYNLSEALDILSFRVLFSTGYKHSLPHFFSLPFRLLPTIIFVANTLVLIRGCPGYLESRL